MRLLLPLFFLACTGPTPLKDDTQAPLRDDVDQDGYSAEEGDCNDADADFSPGVIESCDGLDNDCDGVIDNGALTTFYADQDGDGYGDVGAPVEACNQPADAVSNAQDCDDSRNNVFPGSPEACDGLDNNCNGTIDEGATDAITWYPDLDGDGYGAPNGTASCTPIVGAVELSGDCDDRDADIWPGAPEFCDGLDQDCDGVIDNDAVDPRTWYEDVDADGYGDPAAAAEACTQPNGFGADDSDCDDSDPEIHPGADELCDGQDQDCDGSIDEAAIDAPAWYLDADGDSYGNANRSLSDCSAPAGYVSDTSDCDDLDAATYPGATELCDGADNNCDGRIDENATNMATWYYDADGDNYGDPTRTTSSCSQPNGYVSVNTDCNDAVSTINPGAAESCDGLDNNCNGLVDDGASGASTWYADVDGDGYGDPSSFTSTCSQPSGTVNNNQDCNDRLASVYPGATELCDGVDQDCDGVVDDNAVDAVSLYPDLDGDGYGDENAAPITGCSASGYVSNNGDCDDADASNVTSCGGFTDFDGTTGSAWELRQSFIGGVYGMSLITYQMSDIPYLYNMQGSYVQQYSTAADSWTMLGTAIAFSSSWANFAPYDGYLWGIRAGNVWRFDPSNNSLVAVAAVNQVEDLSATETDEDGYVYGYSGNGNIIIYDTLTGTTRYVGTGLGSQFETRLAYDPDTRNLYLGGFAQANLWAYNLDTGTVTLATTHPEGMLNDVVCSDRSGHIYAVGGSSGTTVYQYSTVSNTWAQIPAFPVDHGINGSCTVTWDGWLYASSGSPANLYRIALY
jgi:hypothetical protein